MVLTHASTFSGIGAPEIAADMLGWKNLFHCEINPFGRAILDYYYPNSVSYEDITKTDFSEWRGKVNILTGGFPCQPFSYAGKRRGSEDDRYLWPYMLRCIEQVQPDWFIGENVAGITTMVFPNKSTKVASGADLFGECNNTYERRERYVLNEICENLERAGYSVQPLLIPACAVGAPHRRDRVWIIAHRDGLATDTTCGGSRAQEPSGRIEGNGSNGLPQQSQRRSETERTDGLSAVQGYATDTECSRGGTLHQHLQSEFANGELSECISREWNVTNTYNERCEQTGIEGAVETKAPSKHQPNYITDYEGLLPANRWRAFPTQSPIYRGNDGLPFDVDDLTIPFSEWKKESLKAYGNAWCVQVGYEIMRAIDELEKQLKTY